MKNSRLEALPRPISSSLALAPVLAMLLVAGSAAAQDGDTGWEVGTEADAPSEPAEAAPEEAGDEASGGDEPKAEDAPASQRTEVTATTKSGKKVVVVIEEEKDASPKKEPEIDVRPESKPDDEDRDDLGGYGGLVLGGTRLADEGAAMFGVEGALISGRWAVGLAGYGVGSDHRYEQAPDPLRDNLGMAYGGLLLRHYFRQPDRFFVPYVGVLLGGGGVAWSTNSDTEELVPEDEQVGEATGFFVVQPSFGASFRLAEWMRLGVEGSYRFISGVEDFGPIAEDDLEGFNFGLSLQFGRF